MKLPEAVGRFTRGGERWTKRSRVWIPEIDDSRRFEVDRLKRELELEERARSDARNLQPASDDIVLNEAQLAICNRVFAGILMLNQFLDEQIGGATNAARERAPKLLNQDDLGKRIEIEAQAAFAERRGPLKQARRRQTEAELNLRYFRSANDLKRSAVYRASPLMFVAVVVAMLALESMLNGLLFKDVVRGGWVIGATIALLISALNVITGIFAGIGWSYIGHVKPMKQAIGWALTVGLHAAAFWWNLVVAHFREAAELAAQSQNYRFNFYGLGQQAFAAMGEGLFALSTLFAWALLGLGVLIHFLAAREGWDDLNDRYPDYAKVDRRAKDTEAEFDAMLVEMRSEAREASETVLRDAAALADAGRRDLNTISDLVNLIDQREQEVRDSEDEWVAGGTLLLRVYRDINVEVRGDNPAPAYFASFPTPDQYRRGDFGAGAMHEGEIDRHVEAVATAKQRLVELREQGESTIAANEETMTALRAEVNRVLADLDRRVEAAEGAAGDAVRAGPAAEPAAGPADGDA